MNKFVDFKCKVYNMFSWFKILSLAFCAWLSLSLCGVVRIDYMDFQYCIEIHLLPNGNVTKL